MADVPSVSLSDGVEIPQLGFGLFQIPSETQRAVEDALAAGDGASVMGGDRDEGDFELTEDDLAAIARLDAGHRIGPDPSTFGAS